jgi:RNA polymerase sigma-70 factor (ECF subfamily)
MKDYLKLGDEQLVYLLKYEDRAAFSEIYNRYWQSLYRQAFWILADEDDAIDIVHDVFISLWNGAADIAVLSLKAYLYKATRNQTLNFISKRKVRSNYVESLAIYIEAGHSSTEEEISYRESDERIKEEIANLPLKMRDIFEKSRYMGLSHRDIAHELDISEHTVKTTISRALKRLRSRLADITIHISLFL